MSEMHDTPKRNEPVACGASFVAEKRPHSQTKLLFADGSQSFHIDSKGILLYILCHYETPNQLHIASELGDEDERRFHNQ